MREVSVDPVLKAAATAFGFVYIHPFQDGNGRMHRCLIHHVLAERKFTPPGMVLPVSSVMLDRIDDYRATLQAHSGPLMPFIEWRPTPERNVEVLNQRPIFTVISIARQTRSFYMRALRIRSSTTCRVRSTICAVTTKRPVGSCMRSRCRTGLLKTLVMFIRQNNGNLSKNRREGEFKKLRDDEVASIESFVNDALEGFDEGSGRLAGRDANG